MNNQITVYEKDNCQACRMTKRWLDQHKIEYATADVTEESNMEMVKNLGYLEAPVVFFGEKSWSGFRPDLLQTILD